MDSSSTMQQMVGKYSSQFTDKFLKTINLLSSRFQHLQDNTQHSSSSSDESSCSLNLSLNPEERLSILVQKELIQQEHFGNHVRGIGTKMQGLVWFTFLRWKFLEKTTIFLSVLFRDCSQVAQGTSWSPPCQSGAVTVWTRQNHSTSFLTHLQKSLIAFFGGTMGTLLPWEIWNHWLSLVSWLLQNPEKSE